METWCADMWKAARDGDMKRFEMIYREHVSSPNDLVPFVDHVMDYFAETLGMGTAEMLAHIEDIIRRKTH